MFLTNILKFFNKNKNLDFYIYKKIITKLKEKKMLVNKEEKFSIATTAFSIGTSSSGYEVEFSLDGVNWTTCEKQTPPNECTIVNGCSKNLYWRLKGNTDNNVLIQW